MGPQSSDGQHRFFTHLHPNHYAHELFEWNFERDDGKHIADRRYLATYSFQLLGSLVLARPQPTPAEGRAGTWNRSDWHGKLIDQRNRRAG